MPQEEQKIVIDKNSMTNSGVSEDEFYNDLEENDELGDDAYSEPGFSFGDDMIGDELPPDDSFLIEPDDYKDKPDPRDVPEDSEEYYSTMAFISSKGDVMYDGNDQMIAGDEFADDENMVDPGLMNPMASSDPENFNEGEVEPSAYDGPSSFGNGESVDFSSGFSSSDSESDASTDVSGDASGTAGDDGNGNNVSSQDGENNVGSDQSVGRASSVSDMDNVSSDGSSSVSQDINDGESGSDGTDGESAPSDVQETGNTEDSNNDANEETQSGDSEENGNGSGNSSDSSNVSSEKTADGSKDVQDKAESAAGAVGAANPAASDVKQDAGNSSGNSVKPGALKGTVSSAPKAVAVKKFSNASGVYSQELNRPSVQKAKDQDISYRLQRKNQIALENADALNKDMLASVELVRQMNISVVDALAKFNVIDQKMRAVIKEGNEVGLRMDQLITKSNNMFTDKYMDNIQKTCERNLSSYIESSRSNYIELFKIAVRDYRNFSDAAMKFQRNMEAKFSNEFRMLVKIIYLLPFLMVINIVLLAIVIWRLM